MRGLFILWLLVVLCASNGGLRNASAADPPVGLRYQSPLLRYHGNGCQTLGPCVAIEKFALFASLNLQTTLLGLGERREIGFGGELAIGMDLLERVALEANFPIAWVHDADDQYLLMPGPFVVGGRIRLGRAAPTIFSPTAAPRVTGAIGVQLVFRLPRAEGDIRHVGALPIGVPQPTVYAVVEGNLKRVQISPHVAIHGAEHAAYIDLGGRVSVRLLDSFTVDVFAVSKLLAQRDPLPGRCPGGTRGGIGLRSVVARGMLLSAQYSAGTGGCEPTHAAMLGLTFAFGGPELIRIPKPEDVKSIGDLWERVRIGAVDPVLDCNGWLLDDESLVPRFKLGDPDPADSTRILADGESFRVGEHFDIDRQGRLYQRGQYLAPILGGRVFTDAKVSEKMELPVCGWGPKQRFKEHCEMLRWSIDQLVQVMQDQGPLASTLGAVPMEMKFEKECLGGKTEEEQRDQIAELFSYLGRGRLRVRPSGMGSTPPGGPSGVRPGGATPPNKSGPGHGSSSAEPVAPHAADPHPPRVPATTMAPDLRDMWLAKATAPRAGGVSPVGRALQKHAARPGSAFTGATGNAQQNTARGRALLRELLDDPNVAVTHQNHNVFGPVVKLRAPDGHGAWFKQDGDFIGFLERYSILGGTSE